MTQSSRKKVSEVPKRINKLRKVFSINIFPQITFMKHLNDCLSVWSVFWKVYLPIICNFVVTHRWIFFLKKQSTFLKKSSFLPTCKKQTWRSFMPIQEKNNNNKRNVYTINNFRTSRVITMKFPRLVTNIEIIIYLLLWNFRDCNFKVIKRIVKLTKLEWQNWKFETENASIQIRTLLIFACTNFRQIS